jgi:hypothetical protein
VRLVEDRLVAILHDARLPLGAADEDLTDRGGGGVTLGGGGGGAGATFGGDSSLSVLFRGNVRWRRSRSSAPPSPRDATRDGAVAILRSFSTRRVAVCTRSRIHQNRDAITLTYASQLP